ncbi:MAG: hypothetical protein FWG16_08455 [Micrococcales bacterium]|nr:hypothetical protein [Micrococcales bacterium]
MARYAGVTASNVAAYEAGTRPMSQAMEKRLNQAMVRPSQVLALHAGAAKDRLAKVQARHVRVFGSVTRGQDTPASDFELLIAVDHLDWDFSLAFQHFYPGFLFFLVLAEFLR